MDLSDLKRAHKKALLTPSTGIVLTTAIPKNGCSGTMVRTAFGLCEILDPYHNGKVTFVVHHTQIYKLIKKIERELREES